MKKVAVITTGGTIGSVLADKAVAVDSSLKHLAQTIELSRKQLGCSIELYSPFNKSSENLRPEDWHDLLMALEQANSSDCAGIVVTHGTDTMEYSVAAALCCAQPWTKKICFTGAYYPPEFPSSDAAINLLAALAWVCDDTHQFGVAVSFSGGQQQSSEILNAIGFKSMLYDERCFSSSGGSLARYDNSGLSQGPANFRQLSPRLPINFVPGSESLASANSRVAFLHLYPGIDLSLLLAAAADRDVLVLQAYHCGTGPADEDSDLLDFIREQSESTGILMAGYSDDLIEFPYESSIELISAGLRLYKNIPAYYLYVYSLIGLAAGLDVKALTESLSDAEVSI